MNKPRTLKRSVPVAVTACALAMLIGGCSHSVTPLNTQRNIPLSSAYTLSSTNPATVGPIHDAFETYFFDSIGNVTTFKALSVDSQASRFSILLNRFLIDSTNIDTSGVATYIVSEYKTEESYAASGDYSNPAWMKERGDSIITTLGLAADEDSSCRALVDTLTYETDEATMTTSLQQMQSQWETRWSTIDGYGTNGTHDYVLGGMLSIAVYSNKLVGTGGEGGPSYGINTLLADAAGFDDGYSHGGLGTGINEAVTYSCMEAFGWF